MTNLVSSYTPSSTRSDSVPWVGLAFNYTGTTGEVIFQLGIWCISGNSGTWDVALCDRVSGAPIIASASIDMSTATPGQFNYAPSTNTANLVNGTEYVLVVNVPVGQTWNDGATVLINDGTADNGAYDVTPGSNAGNLFGGSDYTYVGVDMVFAPLVPSTLPPNGISSGSIGGFAISSGPLAANPPVLVNLTGIAGTGHAGTLIVELSQVNALPGVYAIGQAGIMGVLIGVDTVEIPLTGVAGTGSAGIPTWTQIFPVIGAHGTGFAGTITPLISQSGIATVQLEGVSIAEITENIYFSVRWSDDGGQTWGSPLIQELGTAGEYLLFPTVKNLGMGRDRIFEIWVSAPKAHALSNIWTEYMVSSS